MQCVGQGNVAEPFEDGTPVVSERHVRWRGDERNRVAVHEAEDESPDEVVVRGVSMTMPLREFELLALLAANPGRVMTRDQIISRLWGADYIGDTKTLDTHIKRLRSKVEHDPQAPTHIVTIRGLGYKFELSSETRG